MDPCSLTVAFLTQARTVHCTLVQFLKFCHSTMILVPGNNGFTSEVKALGDLEWSELLPQVEIKQQTYEFLGQVTTFKNAGLHKPVDLADFVHTDLVHGIAGVKWPVAQFGLTGFIRHAFRHVQAPHAAEYNELREVLGSRDAASSQTVIL